MPQLMPLMWGFSNMFFILFMMLGIFIFSNILINMSVIIYKNSNNLYTWCW